MKNTKKRVRRSNLPATPIFLRLARTGPSQEPHTRPDYECRIRVLELGRLQYDGTGFDVVSIEEERPFELEFGK
ncbi:unnamed protein product [Bursaphelenchus xylophilus]|uniref:(pine wood nematode) hypothetical protein n=1 Tax=Bursaphelenchus xylophilus TaxID=6326 RepID=A0A1I7RY33_BURXY|nr:unnamed protein product [Bursaphelenchus xylophilus]CAG9085231.1 unnamed protein product [Bursaphelenchus xylophilus]